MFTYREKMTSKMRCTCIFLYFSLLILIPLFTANTAWSQSDQPKPILHLYIFSSEDCERCEIIEKDNLSRLASKTDCIIETKYFNVGKVENYMFLVKMEEKYGDTDNDLPVVFMGRDVLGGIGEIKQKLAALVLQYIREGGCPWPEKGVSDEPVEATVSGRTVYLAFFYQTGCQECQRIHHLMKYLQHKYPDLSLKQFNLAEKKNKQINEAICQRYNIPDRRRLTTASVFIGEDYLQDKEVTGKRLEQLIAKYSKIGTAPPWELTEDELAQSKQRIIGRFRSFGLAAICTAGLIDGINPCAFTTIIFFISYLTFVGRKGREILLVGGAFTFSVFLTYLLIGLGAFTFIQRLSGYSFLSRAIDFLTASLAAFLGILSLHDFFKARKGNLKDIKLQLPQFLKKRIQLTITREVRIRKYLIAALSAGFIVSILELACTGQVYLPTIVFITSQEGMKGQGFLYLILYNLMFVVPLIAVFALVYFGTSSEQLGKFTQKHLAKVKLLTALFFFSLVALLIASIF